MSYNIVTFCGGGIRGVLSATILKNLADSFPNILTKTNLFAGTSTGSGLISQLLAGKSPEQIIQWYLTQEAKFFQSPGTITTKPAYSVDEVYLGQVLAHGEKKLSHFSQSVLFPAFHVGSANTPWTPILFTNLPGSPTGDTSIATAVTSSSAMPGMLGSWKGNIDGAFVNHDPALAAIAAAIHYGKASLSDIVLIDIGTGFMANWVASDTHAWGAEQWQNGDGNPANNTPALLINGTIAPVLNATLNGTSTNLVPELAGMMLGVNFASLNPTLDRYIPENDVNPADLAYLQEQAAHCDPEQMANALRLLGEYWV